MLQGSVVVKDGLPTMQQIEVRVEKTAGTKERLGQITITHALLDARSVGMILLLQLVCTASYIKVVGWFASSNIFYHQFSDACTPSQSFTRPIFDATYLL